MLKNFLPRLFRKSEIFTASASPETFETHAAPLVPRPGPSSPSGFMASSMPQDIAAKVIGSYRYRTATPSARAGMLRHAADSMGNGAPVASVTPLRSGPAKVVKPAAKPAPDYRALSVELDSLVSLAGRAVARVKAEKARSLSALAPLDRTAIAIRAQLESDAGPLTADVATKIARRSKPSQHPAFVPVPNRDVRLRESNTYYSELATETDAEIERARLAGKIPQELLARRRQIDIDWRNQNDNIMRDSRGAV